MGVTHTPLAGERLQPLGHLSGFAAQYIFNQLGEGGITRRCAPRPFRGHSMGDTHTPLAEERVRFAVRISEEFAARSIESFGLEDLVFLQIPPKLMVGQVEQLGCFTLVVFRLFECGVDHVDLKVLHGLLEIER